MSPRIYRPVFAADHSALFVDRVSSAGNIRRSSETWGRH